jgi:hypothetical protein
MSRSLTDLIKSKLQKAIITSFTAFFVVNCNLCLASPVNDGSAIYPDRAKKQIVGDCLRQPLRYTFNLEFNRVVKPRYCSCYANYIEANLPYNSFKVIDDTIRNDPSSIERLKPEYKKIFETAFTSCFQKVCNLVGVDKCPKT